MITILYDTKDERDNLAAYIRNSFMCCDFSDTVSIRDCATAGFCSRCKNILIDNCIQDRAEYQKLNPFLKNKPKSCSTCANAPICWLATTAAAPAPCAHYIPEVYKHESK